MSISEHTGNEVSIAERERKEEAIGADKNDKDVPPTNGESISLRMEKMKGEANDEGSVEVGNCSPVVENELGSSVLCVGCSGEASNIDGGTTNISGEENPRTEADGDKKAQPEGILHEAKKVKNGVDAETKSNAQVSSNGTYVENAPNVEASPNDNACGEGHSNTHVVDDGPPNAAPTSNGELIANSGGALNVEEDAPLDEGNFSADDRPEENAESTGSFMLEEDLNLSRRAYRNFHICSIFIHGTLLLMVILLMGILFHDFMKPSSVSQKEKIMTYFCGLLLSMLGLHLCLNLYMSLVLLRQAEVSKVLKSVEAKIHVIVLVYFSMCAYIYFFEGKTYPISSIFSFTIILAIIYYFMPIFLYIVLRILFIIVILILIFMKRKSPTPKKILKKLKIMKYMEYRKYCEEEACFRSAYFTNWRELNGEGGSTPQEGVTGTREAMTTTAVEAGTGIAASGGENKGDDIAAVEPTSNCNADGNTISTATSCVRGSSANERPTRSGNSSTRSNLERHLFYDRAGGATGRGGGSSNRGGAQASDREGGNQNGRDNARDNARCNARDNARCNARDNARCNARDNARCNARDNARCNARDNARCNARDNARCNARDNARCNARDNARCNARDNARDNARQHPPPSYDNSREVPNASDEANGEPNKDGKSAAVFEYFQKVLKKKKIALESDNAQVHENYAEENSFHINIESSDYVCSICCVEYLNDDDICILPCNYLHYYHKECIFTWLKRNNDCPLCRKCIGKI